MPSNKEQTKHAQLKEEVVKWPHKYIQGCTIHISCTLASNHKAVKCLVAFGENALKYTTEILATIEWGTQHWKLQEPFPIPPVPKWPCTPEMMQTTMLLRGELRSLLQGYISGTCPKPCPVGVDGHTSSVLARPHDRGSLRRVCP